MAGLPAYLDLAAMSGVRDSIARHVSGACGKPGVDETATLDQDATLIATTKEAALNCYQHCPAYQPFNVSLAEQQTGSTGSSATGTSRLGISSCGSSRSL